MIGEVFGKLTVIERDYDPPNKNSSQAWWKCQCDCGNIKSVRGTNLRRDITRSCGCIHKPHGMSHTLEHYAWTDIIMRCTNKNKAGYKNWGGRGIKVCDRWLESFNNFYDDMGPKPGPDYSIDRIDNNGDYEPGNCKWSTKTEQNRNRRSTKFDMNIATQIRDDFNSGRITNKSELARKYKMSNNNLRSILEFKTWK